MHGRGAVSSPARPLAAVKATIPGLVWCAGSTLYRTSEVWFPLSWRTPEANGLTVRAWYLTVFWDKYGPRTLLDITGSIVKKESPADRRSCSQVEKGCKETRNTR